MMRRPASASRTSSSGESGVRLAIICRSCSTCELLERPAGRKAGGEGGIRTLDALTGITVFETARFSRSRTSPAREIHDLAALVQGRCDHRCDQLFPDSCGFCLDVSLTETSVPLSRHDRSVPKYLLQSGKRPYRLQPPAGERVPKLVSVEMLDAGSAPHPLRKSVRVQERADPSQACPKLQQKRGSQWHTQDATRLGLIEHQHFAGHVCCLGTNELAPAKSRLHEKSANEPLRLLQ